MVRRNRIIAGAVVVAIGVGSAVVTSGAPARPNATYTVNAAKSGLKFSKSTIRARAGSVTLRMGNPSSLPHAIGIKGKGKFNFVSVTQTVFWNDIEWEWETP